MTSHINETTTDDDQWVSKSQKKRDVEALQALGAELIELSNDTLKRLDLPEDLRQAVRDAQKITAHGASKRQRQYIGKLMRQVDPEPIRAFLAALKGENEAHNGWLHRLERLRGKLLESDQALAEFIAEHPDCDVQELRTLIRNSRREQAEQKPPKAFRLLFQHLKNYLPEPPMPGTPQARLQQEAQDD